MLPLELREPVTKVHVSTQAQRQRSTSAANRHREKGCRITNGSGVVHAACVPRAERTVSTNPANTEANESLFQNSQQAVTVKVRVEMQQQKVVMGGRQATEVQVKHRVNKRNAAVPEPVRRSVQAAYENARECRQPVTSQSQNIHVNKNKGPALWKPHASRNTPVGANARAQVLHILAHEATRTSQRQPAALPPKQPEPCFSFQTCPRRRIQPA